MGFVLVTGANGHIGNNLVRLLLNKNYRVRAGVRDPGDPQKMKSLDGLDIERVYVDIMDQDSIMKAMEGVDGVFHLAAVYALWSPDPVRDIIEPSIMGGLNVLKACYERKIRKVIFTSSVAAVGTDSSIQEPLTESDWNTSARSPYFIAKRDAEKKAWEYVYSKDINLITICPSGVIGPGFYRHTPSTEIIYKAMTGRIPFALPLAFSYVDVRDVAEAHRLAYESPTANGRYIVSTEYFDMMTLLRKLNELDRTIRMPVGTLPVPLLVPLCCLDWISSKFTGTQRQITMDLIREFAGKHQFLSTKKIREELSWEPRDIQVTLKDTIDWIRSKWFI